ncbi:metallophosphoesterase [Nitrosopumilus sp. b1]|uniref:metallophosphoesterase family protein n=1 Tax=Nitrosopumilus sp. b1 TaxID=2109907 RepID=UPI0015F75534|nr:exonuclease SbcCD subunit D [Nitrosopumilus sp. b1]KAF6243650.1 metallophosphoesterase [Nitrosopumilus sp. b1]
MRFSHISDTHLGLIQYNSEERENDVYDAFNQAIDRSITDKVDFVIFAGDIFHTPSPSGTAIMHMAHALKKLKQNNIESFFILGEHDISRIRSYPVPYVYHKLEFSKYIGQGEPIYFKDVMIVGFDKIRKSEITEFEEKFAKIDSLAKEFKGHKILVLHQGLSEVNKFAGELDTNDLPKNFTYYAMGHLHDKFLKSFSNLGGPVAYPGSTELTTSEGIKETAKGFFEVDISSKNAEPKWIELELRPQRTLTISFDKLSSTIDQILEEFRNSKKKPIIDIKIRGKDIPSDVVQAQISRLISETLYFTWKIARDGDNSSIYLEKPAKIDDELLKLAITSLKSENLGNFAINELLPLLTSNQIEMANQMVVDNYRQFRKEKLNDKNN